MKLILSPSINSQKALELPPWKTYLISVMCHHYCWSQSFDKRVSPFLMIWQTSDTSPIDTTVLIHFSLRVYTKLLGWKNLSIRFVSLNRWYIYIKNHWHFQIKSAFLHRDTHKNVLVMKILKILNLFAFFLTGFDIFSYHNPPKVFLLIA